MRIRLISLTLALLWAATATAASSSEEARAWIKRMNDALINRNYDGVLTHKWQGGSEALHLIHRMRDGRMVERVVSLNGSGYEVFRNGKDFVEYFPAKRVALVQTRNRSYGHIAALNGVSVDSEKLYRISNEGARPLLGWPSPTQLISVEPRDDDRYGYRFWLDQQTAMPIRTELVSRSGDVIVEIYFSSLKMPDTIADDLFKPDVDVKSFRWMRRDPPAEAAGQAFRPAEKLLPKGYRVLDFNSAAAEAEGKGSRNRFIVSDGIAWVSVFVTVADKPHVNGFKEGFQPQMGASATYVIRQQDHFVTVMGEVPPAVVKSIAQAVRPE